MTISITRYDSGHVIIGAADKRFKDAWGDFIKTYDSNLFNEMENLTNWANNTLKEAVLFEAV